MAKRKIYKVYFMPTGEEWYFLDKKLALKTCKALIDHEKEQYGSMYSPVHVEITDHKIDTKVVFK